MWLLAPPSAPPTTRLARTLCSRSGPQVRHPAACALLACAGPPPAPGLQVLCCSEASTLDRDRGRSTSVLQGSLPERAPRTTQHAPLAALLAKAFHLLPSLVPLSCSALAPHPQCTLPPTDAAKEVGLFKEGGRLVSFLYPAQNKALVDALAARKMTVLGALQPAALGGRGGGGGAAWLVWH